MASIKKISGDSKKIAVKVLRFFKGDKEKAALWWSLANPGLGGISPKDMVRYGRTKRLLEWVENQLAENEPAKEATMKRVQGAGHAGDRLSERFGIKMDAAAHKELLGLIKNGKWSPVRLDGQKLRASLVFRGQAMHVVVNVTNNKIITIIPNEKATDEPLYADEYLREAAEYARQTMGKLYKARYAVSPKFVDYWNQVARCQGIVTKLQEELEKARKTLPAFGNDGKSIEEIKVVTVPDPGDKNLTVDEPAEGQFRVSKDPKCKLCHGKTPVGMLCAKCED